MAKNFLDEAEDVTAEVGYTPKKSALSKKQKSSKPSNFLEEAEDLGEAPKNSGLSLEPSTFEKILNVIDIPGSLVRTGVEAAISPEREVIPSMQQQFLKTVESPGTAAAEAPRGTDIAKSIFPEFKEESIPGQIGGFVTELALDPTSWFRPSKNVVKPIQKSLNSASERQAAKAISKFASKTDVLKEGADLDVIGARLVAEDLQGLLRKPNELYKTLSGERHIQKIGQDLPQTLQIRKGRSEGGKIAETSKEISDAISIIENNFQLNSQIPANVMMRELLNNAKKNVSATSGETVDLGKVEQILENALKPFENIMTPPVIGGSAPGVIKEPTKISLSKLHELRKNIGKQVSDRSFYAASDANVRQETEVLRDLYRTLGDTIQGNLEGKSIKIGNTVVDAGEYYKAQNNKLKSFMDIRSMLEYLPTKELQSPDIAATLASMVTKGGIYGTTAVGASLAGLPVNPLAAGVVGAGFGMAQAASEAVKTSTPEYLTSIIKQMSKVSGTPLLPESAARGTIQYMREGDFVPNQQPEQNNYNFNNIKPAFPFGSKPEDQIKSLPGSSMLSPKEIIKYRIPRTSDGILENKTMVLAKIAQAGVPEEMYESIAYALNESPEQISNVAPLIVSQFPNLFENSKYKIFDNKFIDPNDKAKAADSISKREDLNSIQRAKMINKINKTGEVPEGLA